MPSPANHWSPQRPEWRPANGRPFPRQIVLALANLLPKSHPRAFILFTSGFWKATCKFFNYFGPWTADVQDPLLNLSPMSMVMPVSHGCPPPTRAVVPPCPDAGQNSLVAASPFATSANHPPSPSARPVPRAPTQVHPKPPAFHENDAHLCKTPPALQPAKTRNILYYKNLTN